MGTITATEEKTMNRADVEKFFQENACIFFDREYVPAMKVIEQFGYHALECARNCQGVKMMKYDVLPYQVEVVTLEGVRAAASYRNAELIELESYAD